MARNRTKRRADATAATPAPARSAFGLGTARTVRGTLKRFVALATICALGVTMMVGLRASCVDLRTSADAFFDSQDLFDLRVQSTLGLTQEDVDALAAVDGVEAAEGGWTETAYTAVGSTSEKVEVRALSSTSMNEPQLVEGRLPRAAGEVAVTKRYLDDSGKSIGDTLSFHGSDDDSSDGEKDADAASDAASATADADATSTEVFSRGDYTIVGTVYDPQDINAGEGMMSFRSSGGAQYTFFVTQADVTTDVFTVAYVLVEGADEPLCYSDEYEDLVGDVKTYIEDNIRADREAVRTEGIRREAEDAIDEVEADAQAQLDDAKSQLDDAQAQIDDGTAELAAAERELRSQESSAHAQLGDAQAQIDAGYAQLDAAEKELLANEAQVEDGLSQLAAGLGCSVDGIDAALSQNHDTLVASRASIESSVAMLSSLAGDAWPADAWNRLASAKTADEANAAAAEVSAQIDPFVDECVNAIDAITSYLGSDEFKDTMARYEDAYERLPEEVRARLEGLLDQAPEGVQGTLRQILDLTPDQMVAKLTQIRSMLLQLKQLAPGMAQVVAGEAQLAEAEAAYAQLVSAQQQIAEGKQQVAAGRAELDAGATQLSAERRSALAQIADGWDQIADGRAELADGQAELDDARATYEDERADALVQIADARAQLDDIDTATWYVQDRSSLGSYASVDSDASSIEAIGTVIPVVFFVVAVLISLTTMTRMVEEERGLIGLYKALGYSRGRILSKYVIYALAACVAGAVVGNVAGFIVLPAIIFTIFQTMYALPSLSFCFDAVYSVGSFVLFVVGIVGATVITCRRELREEPASLMRPKAPKAGSRILLERVGPLWRRMGFLNKVTARNLFRYKKRFLMTVLGIGGCTALLITGFGIKDTVVSLSSRQYGEQGVMSYDLMAVTSAENYDDVAAELAAEGQVEDLVGVYVDSVTVDFGGAKESATLVVVPEGASLDTYLRLFDEDGQTLEPGSAGVLVTKNAEQVLGFAAGDTVGLQDSSLAQADVAVDDVFTSYLGNMVIMSEDAYEAAFGEKPEPNGVIVHLSGTSDEKIQFSERLAQDSRWLSVSCTEKLMDDFSGAFTLINTVVYVVIVLAAALSFTVVFTLSNTNISERERELATIKVLGFKRPEVHRYINKETLLLTGLGVLVGMPMGYALARSLTWILKMPSLYFDVVVDPLTYVISAVLAVAFTLVVNQITNRSLDRVDMVGALKSAE